MTDSTRGTWGAEDLPTPPLPDPVGPAASAPTAPGAPESRAARRAAAAAAAAAVTPGAFAAEGAPPSGDASNGGDAPNGGDATAGDGPPAKPGANRRRNLIIAAAVGGVVIVGGAAAALTGVFDSSAPVPTPVASTVTLASPTPTVSPVARQPVSTFADALPSTVLDLALTAIAPQPTLVAANALEAYRLDYSDGGTVAVALDAGQWETPAEAVAAYTPLAAAAPATETGSVDVGGAPVGSWSFSEAADGSGTMTWTNGTALFQATGPAETVKSFYEAFPL